MIGPAEATVALELDPQAAEGVVESRLDRAELDTEDLGGLLERQALEVVEDHHAAVLLRQCGDSLSDDLAQLHAGAEYLVYFIGFTPGLPYMTGMPARINIPRLDTPRTKTPPGSVGIGVRKTDQELLKKINASLAKLQANGSVDKILVKWSLK